MQPFRLLLIIQAPPDAAHASATQYKTTTI